MLNPTEEKSWNTFRADAERGCYVECRQIKALFKEAATMLRLTTDKRGSKQILQHGFEVKAPGGGDRLYLGFVETDERKLPYSEGPIHVQTAQGPRTAIKRVDYVEEATIDFEVWVLATHASETRHIGEEDVVAMLTFGQENGFGADRSQGCGKFDVRKFVVMQRADKRGEEMEPKPGARKSPPKEPTPKRTQK